MDNLFNKNNYEIVSIDNREERIFITSRPIVVKGEEEQKKLQEDKAFLCEDYFDSPMFLDKCDVYEKVDVSDWVYESYTDLREQIANYNPHRTMKK